MATAPPTGSPATESEVYAPALPRAGTAPPPHSTPEVNFDAMTPEAVLSFYLGDTFYGILPYVGERGTGHLGPLDGLADTLGGWGYLMGS